MIYYYHSCFGSRDFIFRDYAIPSSITGIADRVVLLRGFRNLHHPPPPPIHTRPESSPIHPTPLFNNIIDGCTIFLIELRHFPESLLFVLEEPLHQPQDLSVNLY
jgi:hypothetical protein